MIEPTVETRKKAYMRVYMQERAEANRTWTDGIKLASGCIDCGYDDAPEALDFDHRRGETKLFQIGHKPSLLLTTLLAEIDKCDVRCANCHRIITKKRRDEA